MNVREIAGLRSIMGFERGYAIYKAIDENGNYQGVIDRKGEIVWDAKLFPPTLLKHGTTVFMSCIRGKSGFFYYDVAQQKYVEKPELEYPPKSKSQEMADKAPWVEYIDENGHKVSFRGLESLTDDLLAFAEVKNKWGIRDLEGNILVPAQFERINYGGENLFWVKQDGKDGIIDIKGNWVIPCGKYDWLWFRGKYYLAEKDGKKGIIDLQGNTIIPFEYEYLHPSYDEGLDLISAKKDGEFFFINAKQERVDLF